MLRGTRSVARRVFRALTLAALVLGSTALRCHDEPDPPRVAGVELIPPRVFAEKDEPFEMRARLLDQTGNFLPETWTATISWNHGEGAAITPNASRATVTLDASVSPTWIEVEVAGHTSRAQLFVPAPTTAADHLQAPHAAGAAPMIALVDGVNSGDELRSDALVAFVKSAELEDFKDPTACTVRCGEVTLFSKNNGVHRNASTWKAGCDVADYSGGGLGGCNSVGGIAAGALPALQAPTVNVWILAAGASVAATVIADIALAQEVFNDAWTGLKVQPNPSTTLPSRPLTLYTNADLSCTSEVRGQVSDVTGFSARTVTVVYVDEIVDGAGLGPMRGYTCPWNQTDGVIAFVSWGARGETTLAHELGHALGPWVSPDFGHPDGLVGFNESNLMWSYQADNIVGSRRWLSLGQMFRLSLDQDALVNRPIIGNAPVAGVACQREFVLEWRCPRLAKDFRDP